MFDLMTVQEAASLLKVSTMTIYRWVDRGLVEHVRLGRCIRLSRQDVLRIQKQGVSLG